LHSWFEGQILEALQRMIDAALSRELKKKGPSEHEHTTRLISRPWVRIFPR
jgi:hypothetical protein